MQIVDGNAYPYEVKKLIKEYYHRLGRDLSFQNIEEELDDPAVRYSPPHGELLVALENDEVLGMVAYHSLFTSEIFSLHYDNVVTKQPEYVTYIPTLNKTDYIFKSSCIF